MMPIFISSVIDNTVKIIDKTRTGGVMEEDSWQMTALTIIFYMLMIAGALLALTVLLWEYIALFRV